ncbi:MAG: lipoprotein [Methylotenera sp.]|nr:lipoprotein [Methylotenera sp.]NOU25345.1 lipoprotein [Methylotenera sp.]
MQKNTARVLLFLSICLAISSCGTKGPLYIPERQYPQDTRAAK